MVREGESSCDLASSIALSERETMLLEQRVSMERAVVRLGAIKKCRGSFPSIVPEAKYKLNVPPIAISSSMSRMNRALACAATWISMDGAR
jgi:hypothetical protein